MSSSDNDSDDMMQYSSGSEDEELEDIVSDESEQNEEEMNSFGASIASLLSKETPADTTTPVLLGKRKLMTEADEERKILKQQRLDLKLKKMLLEQQHDPKPQFSPMEKKFVRVATKGVVTLFNAVREHQKQSEKDAAAASTTNKVKDLSKDKFLDLLKEKAAKITTAPTPAVAETPAAKSKPSSSWKVLDENYMMGPSIKDWDKDVDSDILTSDDEQEKETVDDIEFD